MLIEVFGTTCPRCDALERHAEAAAGMLRLTAQIRRITDTRQIAARGILETPALIADGVLLVAGRDPGVVELSGLLRPFIPAA